MRRFGTYTDNNHGRIASDSGLFLFLLLFFAIDLKILITFAVTITLSNITSIYDG